MAVFLVLFFDFKDIVHYEFLPSGRTVNTARYADTPVHTSALCFVIFLLKNLSRRIRRTYPHNVTSFYTQEPWQIVVLWPLMRITEIAYRKAKSTIASKIKENAVLYLKVINQLLFLLNGFKEIIYFLR